MWAGLGASVALRGRARSRHVLWPAGVKVATSLILGRAGRGKLLSALLPHAAEHCWMLLLQKEKKRKAAAEEEEAAPAPAAAAEGEKKKKKKKKVAA